MIGRLVLASGNAGKLREFRRLLGPLGIEVIARAALGIPEAEEPHHTFVENALAKARHASQLAGLPALADDSGICVDALDGAPGVQSARYAGLGAADAERVERLLNELSGTQAAERTARFVSVVVVSNAEGNILNISRGECPGHIALSPRGSGGFGYDPIFRPDGKESTFGELPAAVKNEISHRARALSGALSFLRSLTAT